MLLLLVHMVIATPSLLLPLLLRSHHHLVLMMKLLLMLTMHLMWVLLLMLVLLLLLGIGTGHPGTHFTSFWQVFVGARAKGVLLSLGRAAAAAVSLFPHRHQSFGRHFFLVEGERISAPTRRWRHSISRLFASLVLPFGSGLFHRILSRPTSLPLARGRLACTGIELVRIISLRSGHHG